MLIIQRSFVTEETLLVSIAAGTPLSRLSECCPEIKRIIRVMPNTPCLIGEAASAFCLGENATKEGVFSERYPNFKHNFFSILLMFGKVTDLFQSCGVICSLDANVVRSLMASVGEIVEVPEKLMDAVTGLSGSGPAYVYLLIEAMSDGGVAAGLPRDVATVLAAKTVCGAAKMVLETGDHPGKLKDMVTSPAGTTMAGVRALEANKFRSTLIEAVVSASNRASELSKL